MIVNLTPLPDTLRGPAGDGYGGRVPVRFRFLAPDAAAAFLSMLEALDNRLVFSDIYRSAQGSRDAYASKPGTQRPAYSAHGYGLAFDLDLTATLHAAEVSYAALCDLLGDFGWFCHRRDLDSGASESWHFNYLGADAAKYLAEVDPQHPATWSRAVELRILERWGACFHLTPDDIGVALAKAKCADVPAFQRAWGLAVDGIAGPVTQRVLAFVTADVHIAPPASH